MKVVKVRREGGYESTRALDDDEVQDLRLDDDVVSLEILDREPTWQELARVLDGEAENENYHSLVGAHDKLAELILDAGIDPETTAKVMLGIVKAGGLMRLGVG